VRSGRSLTAAEDLGWFDSLRQRSGDGRSLHRFGSIQSGGEMCGEVGSNQRES
jgi:hypothetical protein